MVFRQWRTFSARQKALRKVVSQLFLLRRTQPWKKKRSFETLQCYPKPRYPRHKKLRLQYEKTFRYSGHWLSLQSRTDYRLFENTLNDGLDMEHVELHMMIHEQPNILWRGRALVVHRGRLRIGAGGGQTATEFCVVYPMKNLQ